jgi:hypothetical protein
VDLMGAIKHTLDPESLMHPGKVVPEAERAGHYDEAAGRARCDNRGP